MAERDDSGRFVKGQTGNPNGRPKRRTEEQYLDATIARVTIKDWREIVDKAVSQAKRGDSRARAWLSDYVLGVPVKTVDVTSGGQPITGYARVFPDDWDNEPTGDAGA